MNKNILDSIEVKALSSLAKFMNDFSDSNEFPNELLQQIWMTAYQDGYQESVIDALDGANLIISGVLK